MTYIYESIQPGVFNFTVPGEDKTVTLFKGSKVTVKQKLTGGYLRVLKLVEEVEDEKVEAPAKKTTKKATTNKAKVEDKITEIAETVEVPAEEVEVKVEDTVVEVKEEKPTTTARKGRRKRS